MDLNENLKQAEAKLKECEQTLLQMQQGHAAAVKDQKAVISVAKANVKAWRVLVEKANEINK